jgi:5-deoxy-5-amino-3-dehydroquinate synthase
MMGSGKSAVGEMLARVLSRAFIDTDGEIESLEGRSIAEIFSSNGERGFRAEEAKAIKHAVDMLPPAVIALGGGSVLDEANRAVIRSSGRVVWLRATTNTLIARLGDGFGRPLLQGDTTAAILRLDSERRPRYEEVADIVIDVDNLPLTGVVSAVLDALQQRVRVVLDERSYDVIVGPGARHFIAEMIPDSARRVAIVTQEGIGVSLECPIPTGVFFIANGEKAKSLAVVEELCRTFAQIGLTRNDAVVALGGGVVSDVAGFAAACYHRGTAVINVPTTLIGQIDAAIGGKTGVNIPEGKNLIGAFHQPRGVLCDSDTLVSLPEREWRSGLGEMAKYAFLGVDDLDRLPIVDQVVRCVQEKARVVSIDERESGARAVLNYGHTLGHALEATGLTRKGRSQGGLDLRHGEAVAIGLVFSAMLAKALGRIDAARVKRHLEVLENYGLGVDLPAGMDLDEILSFMVRDKKATEGLTFVLDGPSGPEVVKGVSKDLVKEVLQSMAMHEQPVGVNESRR